MYAGIVDPLGTLFSPVYSVSSIITHEGFNSVTRRNDVALMRLSEPLHITGAHTHIYTHRNTVIKEIETHSAKLIPIPTHFFPAACFPVCRNLFVTINQWIYSILSLVSHCSFCNNNKTLGRVYPLCTHTETGVYVIYPALIGLNGVDKIIETPVRITASSKMITHSNQHLSETAIHYIIGSMKGGFTAGLLY